MTINSLIFNFSEDHKSIENVLCGFCSSHINRTCDVSSLQFPFKELNKTFILKEQNENKTKTWKEYNRIFQSLLLQAKSILGRTPLHFITLIKNQIQNCLWYCFGSGSERNCCHYNFFQTVQVTWKQTHKTNNKGCHKTQPQCYYNHETYKIQCCKIKIFGP